MLARHGYVMPSNHDRLRSSQSFQTLPCRQSKYEVVLGISEVPFLYVIAVIDGEEGPGDSEEQLTRRTFPIGEVPTFSGWSGGSTSVSSY